MIRHFISASVALICSLASTSMARPIVNQLNLATTAGTVSQERASTSDTRSADDFVMPGPSNTITDISVIELVMVGKGTANVLPSASKFGVTIYANSTLGGDHPSTALYTRLGANAVQDLGGLNYGNRRYKVTFVVPTGLVRVYNARRYWISGFGRLDDANTWCFGQATGSVGKPTWIQAGGTWSAVPAAWGDRSFRLIGY